MKKFWYILKEMFYMIRTHKLYFLAPLFLLFVILALLVFYIGPSVIISFIYAGI
ncbi:MAG: hypothetical protein Q7O04_00345 [Candidatus Omnitrophota bacterium]|nr:hypothetical protein [Candidatus Omnitrophota bacterium]